MELLFNQVVVLRGIILTADQKIVVCGDGKDNKGHVISLLSDGTLDNAFTWNVRTYQNVQKSLGNTIGLLSGR